MNSKTIALLYLIFVCSFANGDAAIPNKTEARGAAFFPISSTVREVYGDVGISVQVEQARAFKDYKNLEVWGNFEWIFFGSDLHRSCGSSHIDMLNLSVGLKGIGNVYRDWIYLYAGIGPDLGFSYIANTLKCCDDCDDSIMKTRNWNIGVGGIAKSGCQLFCTRNFFLDFFADYLYLPIHFSSTVDMGGFKLGVGFSGRY